MLFFPRDIMIEILQKVPARDLQRLRCVSKSWRALIDSPIFTDLHLRHSAQTNSDQSLVFYDDAELFYSRMDDLLDHNGIMKFNFPLELGPDCPMLLGSCNGLLLVCFRGHTSWTRLFVIWNPNTKEYKSLPTPLPPLRDCSPYRTWVKSYFGFGYDSERDDYIVVQISQNFSFKILSEESYNEVQNYSLKSNSWRRIGCASLPLSLRFKDLSVIFASGALHWLVREEKKEYDWLILAFDVRAEEFRFVAKPDNLREAQWMELVQLKGELCLSFSYDTSEIWIMREYGVKESWVKLFSLPLPSSSDWYYDRRIVHVQINKPIAYSSFGNKILLTKSPGNLILYDVAGGTVEHVFIEQLNRPFVAYSCVDSLVRLSNYDTCVIKYSKIARKKVMPRKKEVMEISEFI